MVVSMKDNTANVSESSSNHACIPIWQPVMVLYS